MAPALVQVSRPPCLASPPQLLPGLWPWFGPLVVPRTCYGSPVPSGESPAPHRGPAWPGPCLLDQPHGTSLPSGNSLLQLFCLTGALSTQHTPASLCSIPLPIQQLLLLQEALLDSHTGLGAPLIPSPSPDHPGSLLSGGWSVSSNGL